jgi:hypothetical protein
VKVRARDIFCAECGVKIDHETRVVDELNNGAITAMLMNDAVHIHRRESECAAKGGWREGEWGEEFER